MILLKYARLLHPDANENIWLKYQMDDSTKQLFLYRVKEFVVCGHSIDAKDAVHLSDLERSVLYYAKVEWEKEKASLNALTNLVKTEDEKNNLLEAMPEKPCTEDDLIQEYLTQAILFYG